MVHFEKFYHQVLHSLELWFPDQHAESPEIEDTINLTLKRLGGRGINWNPSCGFSKTVFSRDELKAWVFVSFNIIIRNIFHENAFEIPQVF